MRQLLLSIDVIFVIKQSVFVTLPNPITKSSMNLKYLNLITYPLRLLVLPIALVLYFIITDWNNELDIQTTKKCLLDLIKPV